MGSACFYGHRQQSYCNSKTSLKMQLFVISWSGDAPLPSKILLGYTTNWTWFPPEIHPPNQKIIHDSFTCVLKLTGLLWRQIKGKKYVLDWHPTPMDDNQRFLCSFLATRSALWPLMLACVTAALVGTMQSICVVSHLGLVNRYLFFFFCNHCSYVIFVPYPDLSLGSDSSGDI